jgi:hypothetical protein
MPSQQSELTVIVKAKDLASYVLTVTEKSPKRFRFTLVAKLQGYALNIIENLYRANEVYVAKGDTDAAARRLAYQHQALTELKLLGYMAQLSMQQGCILAKQYEQITRKVYDCRNLCGAWVTADRKRLAIERPKQDDVALKQPGKEPQPTPCQQQQYRQLLLFDAPSD